MMETIDYQVVPEWGNPLGFFLLAREKGIRWHVTKVFENERQAAYHYRFTHLSAQGKPVSPAAYAGYALNLGISRADNERAAR